MQVTKMLCVLFLHRFLQMETWIERLTSPGNGHACRIRLLGISLSFCAWFTNGGKMVCLHSAVPLLTPELPLQLMFELQAYIFLFPHYTSSSLKY